MQVPEGIEFNCGNCAWMQKVKPPKGEKVDDERGYCTFNPPSVFPMPKQTSNLADVRGQQNLQMVPFMIRPVVEGREPPCGRYAPDTNMLQVLAEAQPEDAGACCKDKGAKHGCC